MVTAINTPALAGSVTGGAEQLAKALDAGHKAAPSVDEAPAVVVKISAEGARQAGRAAPAPPPVQVAEPESRASEPQAAPAVASGGGTRVAAPADDGSTVGATLTSQTHDPADTDEDGKVSAQELQTYEAKLADEKKAQAQADSARAVEADAALKAYGAVEQLGAAG